MYMAFLTVPSSLDRNPSTCQAQRSSATAVSTGRQDGILSFCQRFGLRFGLSFVGKGVGLTHEHHDGAVVKGPAALSAPEKVALVPARVGSPDATEHLQHAHGQRRMREEREEHSESGSRPERCSARRAACLSCTRRRNPLPRPESLLLAKSMSVLKVFGGSGCVKTQELTGGSFAR